MSLSQAALKQAILDYVQPADDKPEHFPGDMTVSAQRWAQAYDTYASAAVDASGDPVVSKAPAGFQSALAALSGPVGSASAAALAFDNAFRAYWTGAVFAVGTPPPGGVGGDGIFATELTSVVSAVAPGVLQASLEAVFAVPSSDRDLVAGAIAAAMHAATTSAVTVVIAGMDTTPSPAGPLPITNTGVIH